jgi:hypothetical protein
MTYSDLITSEHNDKPNFVAVVDLLTSEFVDLQSLYVDITRLYDLDTAVGSQLDVVGQWVGFSRRIPTPLENVYFEWDGEASLGWNYGAWQGAYDSDTGLTILSDEYYRTLLRAKILANRWDGSIPMAYSIYAAAFNWDSRVQNSNRWDDGTFVWDISLWDVGIELASHLIIQDYQDMTMVIILVGKRLEAVEKAILLNGYFPIKPEGVRLLAIAESATTTGPVFSWDTNESTLVEGWGAGEWAIF